MAKQASLFQTLQYEAFRRGVTPRTRQSADWFRRKAQKMSGLSRDNVMKQDPLERVGKVAPGMMCMYFYDPKHKKTLPYYDKFPITVIIDVDGKGFTGLNLHYLQPVLRAHMLDDLLSTLNNRKYDDTTKFRLSYKRLKGLSSNKYFAPCYKRYLWKHVRSKFAVVPAPEYEIAVFLPLQQFEGASSRKVWAESRKKL